MVVHLEHTGIAGRAVMCTIRLTGLALLAVTSLAIRLDRQRICWNRSVAWQGAVSVASRGVTRAGEDGGQVGPGHEQIYADRQDRRERAYSQLVSITGFAMYQSTANIPHHWSLDS